MQRGRRPSADARGSSSPLGQCGFETGAARSLLAYTLQSIEVSTSPLIAATPLRRARRVAARSPMSGASRRAMGADAGYEALSQT